MKLYFRNSRKKERLLAECSNYDEVNKEIQKFFKEHDYKSPYTRIWYGTVGTGYGKEEKRFIYDVGSWSEFFELYVSDEEKDLLPEQLGEMMEPVE